MGESKAVSMANVDGKRTDASLGGMEYKLASKNSWFWRCSLILSVVYALSSDSG